MYKGEKYHESEYSKDAKNNIRKLKLLQMNEDGKTGTMKAIESGTFGEYGMGVGGVNSKDINGQTALMYIAKSKKIFKKNE